MQAVSGNPGYVKEYSQIKPRKGEVSGMSRPRVLEASSSAFETDEVGVSLLYFMGVQQPKFEFPLTSITVLPLRGVTVVGIQLERGMAGYSVDAYLPDGNGMFSRSIPSYPRPSFSVGLAELLDVADSLEEEMEREARLMHGLIDLAQERR